MRIYLMQHGVSLPREVDQDQGVSPVGREEVETCAMAVRLMGITFSVIFASPKKRSLQTARIMAEGTGFPEDNIEIHDDMKAMAAPEKTLQRLQQSGCGTSVLICGHLPNLSRVASVLLTSGPQCSIAFQNAGLMCISLEQLPTRSATLEWYLRPEHLAELAR